MKVNKIFGVKSITNLIYGMLLLLPMASILSRVIYTQANPNAKDSYSLTQGTESVYTGQQDSIILNQYYIFSTNLDLTINDNNRVINVDEFSIVGGNWSVWSNKSIKIINFRNYHSGNGWYIHLENEQHNHYYVQYASADGTSITSNLIFTFKASLSYEINPYKNFIELITFAKNDYLDNSFEYSISSFLNDYDNQSIDFFSWFTDLFLNQSNSHNALYLNFCNWYMNYVLLVSSAYLLFFALMWFINYIRKLLEKSSYHDFGGF